MRYKENAVSENKGRINAFQTFGTLEGPGIRFVVFFQGCALRCAYCHNPETWNLQEGSLYTVDEVIAKALRCKPYFGDTGGITLSGGEPLLQSTFAAELLRAAKAKSLHTAICTAGSADLDGARAVLQYTDLVIADLKFSTDEDYAKYCKGNLQTVLRFLQLTEEMHRPLWIRQVIVPGINDKPADAGALCAIAKQFSNVEKIELLPFRKFCLEKYAEIGIPFPLQDTPEADDAVMHPLLDVLDKCGF